MAKHAADAARRRRQGAAQPIDALPRGRHAVRWATGACVAHPALDAATGTSPGQPPRRMRSGACFPAPETPRAGTIWSSARSRGPMVRGTVTRPRGPGAVRVRADGHHRLLAPLDIAEVAGDAGRRFERRVFSGVDQWGALPDGSIWVARVYANRVDWRDPAGQVDPRRSAARPGARGDPLRSRALRPQVSARASQHGRAASVRAVKPPFEAGFTGPAGEAWLEKSRAPIDSSRRYHVVDRRRPAAGGDPRPGARGVSSRSGPDAALVAEPSRDGVRLIRFDLPAHAADSTPH